MSWGECWHGAKRDWYRNLVTGVSQPSQCRDTATSRNRWLGGSFVYLAIQLMGESD